jgi:hypothetical protein
MDSVEYGIPTFDQAKYLSPKILGRFFTEHDLKFAIDYFKRDLRDKHLVKKLKEKLALIKKDLQEEKKHLDKQIKLAHKGDVSIRSIIKELKEAAQGWDSPYFAEEAIKLETGTFEEKKPKSLKYTKTQVEIITVDDEGEDEQKIKVDGVTTGSWVIYSFGKLTKVSFVPKNRTIATVRNLTTGKKFLNELFTKEPGLYNETNIKELAKHEKLLVSLADQVNTSVDKKGIERTFPAPVYGIIEKEKKKTRNYIGIGQIIGNWQIFENKFYLKDSGHLAATFNNKSQVEDFIYILNINNLLNMKYDEFFKKGELGSGISKKGYFTTKAEGYVKYGTSSEADFNDIDISIEEFYQRRAKRRKKEELERKKEVLIRKIHSLTRNVSYDQAYPISLRIKDVLKEYIKLTGSNDLEDPDLEQKIKKVFSDAEVYKDQLEKSEAKNAAAKEYEKQFKPLTDKIYKKIDHLMKAIADKDLKKSEEIFKSINRNWDLVPYEHPSYNKLRDKIEYDLADLIESMKGKQNYERFYQQFEKAQRDYIPQHPDMVAIWLTDLGFEQSNPNFDELVEVFTTEFKNAVDHLDDEEQALEEEDYEDLKDLITKIKSKRFTENIISDSYVTLNYQDKFEAILEKAQKLVKQTRKLEKVQTWTNEKLEDAQDLVAEIQEIQDEVKASNFNLKVFYKYLNDKDIKYYIDKTPIYERALSDLITDLEDATGTFLQPAKVLPGQLGFDFNAPSHPTPTRKVKKIKKKVKQKRTKRESTTSRTRTKKAKAKKVKKKVKSDKKPKIIPDLLDYVTRAPLPHEFPKVVGSLKWKRAMRDGKTLAYKRITAKPLGDKEVLINDVRLLKGPGREVFNLLAYYEDRGRFPDAFVEWRAKIGKTAKMSAKQYNLNDFVYIKEPNARKYHICTTIPDLSPDPPLMWCYTACKKEITGRIGAPQGITEHDICKQGLDNVLGGKVQPISQSDYRKATEKQRKEEKKQPKGEWAINKLDLLQMFIDYIEKNPFEVGWMEGPNRIFLTITGGKLVKEKEPYVSITYRTNSDFTIDPKETKFHIEPNGSITRVGPSPRVMSAVALRGSNKALSEITSGLSEKLHKKFNLDKVVFV